MKQNLGLIATVTLLLGIIGVSSMPKTSPGGAASETGAKSRLAKQQPSAGPASRPQSACEEIARRISPLLLQSPELWALPDSCYKEKPTA